MTDHGSCHGTIEGICCHVRNCKYHSENNCCHADKIQVGPGPADDAHETECATFEAE